MQIHELPGYSGEPETSDVFPLDTGTHTFKLSFADLGAAIITTATATISGAVQTVKAAIEALAGRVATLESKTTSYMIMKYVSGTIPANSTSVSLSATVDSGYVFVGWCYCASVGWLGHVYAASNTQSATFFTSSGSSTAARDFNAFYILRK